MKCFEQKFGVENLVPLFIQATLLYRNLVRKLQEQPNCPIYNWFETAVTAIERRDSAVTAAGGGRGQAVGST